MEVVDATFDIVAYMVAVFFGGEPRDSEFAAVDAQPRNVHGFRRCGICDLNDLLKDMNGSDTVQKGLTPPLIARAFKDDCHCSPVRPIEKPRSNKPRI